MTPEELHALQEQVMRLDQDQRTALLEALQSDLRPVPGWHLDIIDERVAHADANPDSLAPADEVIERVRETLRRQ